MLQVDQISYVENKDGSLKVILQGDQNETK